MHWINFLWLPSALLAWPLHRLVNHPISSYPNFGADWQANLWSEFSWNGATWAEPLPHDQLIRRVVFSVASLALLGMVCGFVRRASSERIVSKSLQQPAATVGQNARVLRGQWISQEWGWKVLWLVLQPFILVLLKWPAVISSFGGGFYESSILLAGAAIPTVVFESLFRSQGIKHAVFGNLLLVALTSVAAIVETLVAVRTLLSVPVRDGQAEIGGAVLSEVVAWRASASLWHTDTFVLVLILFVAGCLTTCIVPAWMAWATDASELEDERRRHWESLWGRLHLRAPKMLYWPTNHRFANAVVVAGLISKQLFLTDRLLNRYSRSDIDLVLLHEIAHAVRYHYLVRLLPAMLVVPVMLIVLQSCTGIALALACCSVLVLLVGLIMATCWWTELDADRHAVVLASKVLGLDTVQARNKLADVLTRIYADNRVERTSWSHPSLIKRVDSLLGRRGVAK